MERLQVIGLMLVVTLCTGVSQIAIKGGLELAKAEGRASLLGMFRHPLIPLALVCYVVGTLAYLLAARQARISYVYPLTAVNYLVITALAWRFLGEQVSRQQILGLLVIFLGVVIFATQPEPSATAAPSPGVAAGE